MDVIVDWKKWFIEIVDWKIGIVVDWVLAYERDINQAKDKDKYLDIIKNNYNNIKCL